MKVIAINGSPNKNGNTRFAINLVAEELKKENINVEVLDVGNEEIRGCMACGGCRKNLDLKCVINDDKVNDSILKLKDADGIIIGSPVHYSALTGNLKAFLDRVFYVASANGGLLRHKVGAGVVAVRRSGGSNTFGQLNNYFLISEMIIPGSNYWNIIHGGKSGDAQFDTEGVQVMQLLGKNMAWVLKLIENGKGNVSEPEKEGKIFMNFIR